MEQDQSVDLLKGLQKLIKKSVTLKKQDDDTENKPEKRARGYYFTLNNYDDYDYGNIIEMCEKVDYLIVGFEIGSEGTEHMQGFLYCKNKISFTTVKDILQYAHIESMKGTPVEALLYCMKDGNYYEYGNRPRQGKRSDLDVIANDIKNKTKSIEQISLEHPTQWNFHRRAFQEFARMHVRYDTMTMYYTDDEIPLVYEKYDRADSLIIEQMDNNYYYHKLLHLMHSKKYKYILFPYGLYQQNREHLNGKVFSISE